MFQRECNLPRQNSFFLFGARGTGKSTLLKSSFPGAQIVDLLKAENEDRLRDNPDALMGMLAPHSGLTHVIVDEVQKLPKLLDVVHHIMENTSRNLHFILTGSSSRKLKAGGANLLAGRAFVRNLYPLTVHELGSSFDLMETLSYGTLPKVCTYSSKAEKQDYLESYAQTYLREEILLEQIIRNLPPFRKFLEISAIQFGKILNYARMGRDVGVDPKTVQAYYSILEDTLLGFHLEAFHSSARKRLRTAPKFYFFDCGVTRALARYLTLDLRESTSFYGDLFEQFVMCEIWRRNDYQKKNFRMSYLQSAAGVEVDLVIERPGMPLALVEIKSKSRVLEEDASSLFAFQNSFPDAELFLFSRDTVTQKWGRVLAVSWIDGLNTLFS